MNWRRTSIVTDRKVVQAYEDNVMESLPVIDYYGLGAAHVSKETTGIDPFMRTGEEVKSLGNLTPVFKRKLTGELKKVYRGVGAESKKIEIDEISGYNA